MDKILILAGPTASGKTEVAYEISKRIPCEMISCDSMQVYRGMPILTQAPSKKIIRKLKTHLVSFLDPSREYSAARFRQDAQILIENIQKNKKTSLIAGGTGLYFRALLDGLFEHENDSKDDILRKKFLAEQEKHGGSFLHDKLAHVDADAARKIHPNDLRRTVRALEVFYLTGRTISSQKPNRQGIRSVYDCRFFMLDREREDLYERINRRVDRMMRAGLLSEVKRLKRKKLSMTAGVALGLREMKDYLGGECSLDKAVELLKQHTRNYAKRQLSWFRHEKGIEKILVEKNETAAQTAKKILMSFRARAEGPSRGIL